MAVLFSIVAVGVGIAALARAGDRTPSSSTSALRAELRTEQADVASLKSQLAASTHQAAVARSSVKHIDACLPELWQYVNGAQLETDTSSNTIYLNWGQQIASVCNKVLTGY